MMVSRKRSSWPVPPAERDAWPSPWPAGRHDHRLPEATTMQWSDACATGIELLDYQHKLLFKMAEALHTVLDEGQGERAYGGLLQSLDLYARYHFGIEERCMDQYRCPMAQRNREAHAQFAEPLSGFQQRYVASGFDHVDGCTLVAIIDQWLTDHICRLDAQLRPCVTRTSPP
jgi:hemerythrin